MKKLSMLAALACMTVGPLLATSAQAQFAKPEDAVKYRQSALSLMASHFGRMTPVIKGQAPYDAAQIKANVEVLKTLSALPWTAFGAGTEGGDARPEIWSDAAGFKQKQQAFQDNIVSSGRRRRRRPGLRARLRRRGRELQGLPRRVPQEEVTAPRASRPGWQRPQGRVPRGVFHCAPPAMKKPPGSSGRLALRFVCRRGV